MSEQSNLPNAAAIEDDFFRGDTRAGIERMRARLLDLSNRNRLLNFPEKPSKQVLRVVDELPDVLFQKLREGKQLIFKPVPEPSRDEFQQVSLEEFFGNPDIFLLDENSAEVTTAALPTSSRKPNARQHAERLGINISFDLPEMKLISHENLAANHTDRYIQTLHYPDELEGILRHIAGNARTAINESGVNMLYLVFGFLEWYESANSDVSHRAPLLVVPVSLKRGNPDPQTGAYNYQIEYSGEDIEANLTLREMLRQKFNLSLPDLAEDNQPETYFEKFSPIFTQQKRWRIRRQVTLAMLSFGKLLMYRDLDPQNWPQQQLLQHARIREFFEGTPVEEISFSQDYSLDQPETFIEIPPLIDDADTSQHSALIDALAGKNLVIEGPPGTGKSQTIVNLIAAALAKGKTVLFVSAKLAAVEVVRSRLDKVGLGDFCLELHSHKTQKEGVIKDIRKRLSLKGTFRLPTEIAHKKRLLEENKRKLIDYVETVNSKVEGTDKTIQQMMWSQQRLRSELRFDLSLIEPILMENRESFTLEHAHQLERDIKIYAGHLSQVLRGVHLQTHPWFGVTNQRLTYLEQSELLRRLKEWTEAAEQLDARIAEFNNQTGLGVQNNDSSLSNLLQIKTSLPQATSGLLKEFIPKLANAETRRPIRLLCERLRACRQLQSSLQAQIAIPQPLTSAHVDALQADHEQAQRVGLTAMSLKGIQHYVSWLEQLASYLDNQLPLLEQICRYLSCGFPLNIESAATLLSVFELLDVTPFESLHLRHTLLEVDGIARLIDQAQNEAEKIRHQTAEISKSVDLNLAPSREDCAKYAVICANAGNMSFLDGGFRSAQRSWRGMSRSSGKVSKAQMAQGYRILVQHFDGLTAFDNNQRYRAALGILFDGLKTPFAEIRKLLSWQAAVRQKFAPTSEMAASTAKALLSAAADNLSALKALRQSRSTEIAAFQKFIDEFQTYTHNLPAFLHQEAYGDWRILAALFKDWAEHFRATIAPFHELRLNPDLPLSEIPQLLSSLRKLLHLNAEIQVSQAAIAAHEFGPISIETDIAAVTKTIEFVDNLEASSLSEEIKKWLITSDIEERIEQLTSAINLLGEYYQRFSQAKESFAQFAGLNFGDWYYEDGSSEITFRQMRTRALSALNSAADLSNWLAYLRARQPLIDAGLVSLVSVIGDGRITGQEIFPAFKYIYQNSLLNAAFKANPPLMQFDGLTLNQIRRQFAELDQELIKLTREEIAWQLDQREIPMGNSQGSVATFSELGLLRNQMGLQRRHLPIRKLLRRAGKAIQALKSCFMMGPLSVAQYIEPGELQFDLVVMDEASQLKPEDALGAIARGSQIVIVGDRMQLPPTNFFDRVVVGGASDEDGDENISAMDDAQSILEVASCLYQPSRMLKWHYRSRHESLIAFSNKEFYDNELTVFPAAAEKSEELGIKFNYVSDGVYQGQQNVIEAQRVVEAVLEHLCDCPGESLGVVAFNMKQANLIESLLSQQLKKDTIASQRIDEFEKGAEPFFVKNLETVQGDERDTIFISVTYSKDETGKPDNRSFGPINRANGHRRLNVLITRAKKRVVVFSSMDPEEIRVEPGSSRGLQALKGYLSYAKTGVLQQAEFSLREPDSDFEVVVAKALKDRGYEVQAQVGVANYWIDMAVRHPKKSGAYILGIECDGATYHSSRSARDRDRIREAVLKGLGWNIHRIWSTDWFRNGEREIEKVVTRINDLLQKGQ